MTGDHPPLIVGVDGSERSHDALALAARLAESGQSISLEERTREAIDSLPDGDRVDGQVLDGDVASQFIAASAELDLLVLGPRGYGPVRSVLLGSVSRALGRPAACPVVVVPRGLAADVVQAGPNYIQ
jgi:Universal stress protein family